MTINTELIENKSLDFQDNNLNFYNIQYYTNKYKNIIRY